MPSMIQWLLDHLGNEVQRGLSGGQVTFTYRGLWDATGDTAYAVGDVVRYISTDEEDCGDGCYVATRIVTPSASFDAATWNPCVLTNDPETPWWTVSDRNTPIEILGPGDPNQVEEGDSDDGPVPLPIGSLWRSLTGGASLVYVKNQDGSWSETEGGGGGGSVTLSATPPEGAAIGDIWVRYTSGTELNDALPIDGFAYRQAYVNTGSGAVGVPGAEGWVGLGQAFYDADGILRGILTFSTGALTLLAFDASQVLVSELVLLNDGRAQLFSWAEGAVAYGVSVEPTGIRVGKGGIGGGNPYVFKQVDDVPTSAGDPLDVAAAPLASLVTVIPGDGTASLFFRSGSDGNDGDWTDLTP